ncbi:LysM peptidoglycan-binding domain-containing protein [Serratia aquatilis]|uniref:TIGR02594 family protein n=1 Tax=Serratia aquatilis TaxID=1737515 RepID=A0ABV6EFU5_9GAMM
MSHNFISATYDKRTLTAMYKMADGTIYIRKGGTIPWRLQNPGNVRPNSDDSPDSEYLQPLRLAIADTASGKFSMFSSEEDGWETKKKLLRTSLYRDCTISEMAEIYAPSGDGNDPEKYAKDVLKASGVSPDITLGDMDDATLEKVMQGMKKIEGYFSLKETRVEKWIATTNINLTDGIRPIPDCQLKVTIGNCEYEWKTNEVGALPTIAHILEGMKIEVKTVNSKGEDKILYLARAGKESKSIVLKKKFIQHKANTLAHNPKVPREKSQPEPIEYIVRSGDVLSKIASRFDVNTSELAANNNIKYANKIYPGQRIIIYGKKEKSTVDLKEQLPWEEHGESFPVPSYPQSIESKNSISNSPYSTRNEAKPSQHDVRTPQGKSSSIYPTSVERKDSVSKPPSVSTATVYQHYEKKNKEKLDTIGGKNSGKSQAILPFSNNEAPWMAIAMAEVSNCGGIDESNIPKEHNYHVLINKKSKQNLSTTPWCASFVNYCIHKAGYPMSHNPTGSVSFVGDINFKKIKKPVYGCLTVWWSSIAKQGHVAFVFGIDSVTSEIIVLGGNQNDSLNFMLKNDTSKPCVGYFIPVLYNPPTQSELGVYDIIELNKDINYTYTRSSKHRVKDR